MKKSVIFSLLVCAFTFPLLANNSDASDDLQRAREQMEERRLRELEERERRYQEELRRQEEEHAKYLEQLDQERAEARRRIEKALEEISKIKVEVPPEIANAIVIVRPGVMDLGEMTVDEYIGRIYLSPLLNKKKGCEWEGQGWSFSSSDHNLVCHYPNANAKFKFTMSEDNKVALLKVYNLKRNIEIPAMTASAMFLGGD